MAQVTKDVHADIDRLLVYLAGEYEWAVETSAGWSDGELDSFIAEQPLRDEMLDDLEAYAAHSRLSAEQQHAYARLIHLLEQHQALFDGLLVS